MPLKISNILKANAELTASDSVIDPALASAGITAIPVAGKPVPASDAPLNLKISAMLAAIKPGAASTEASDLIASNDLISQELDKTKTDLAVSKASVDSLTAENAKLKTDLQTAQASVATLTASNAELLNRHEAAVRQVSATTAQINSINSEVSKACLSVSCLELTTEDGKAVSASASDDEKLASANRIPVADKIKSFKGAFHAAIAKVGVNISTIPSAAAQDGPAQVKKMTRAEFLALTPKAQTEFFKGGGKLVD